MLLFFVRRQRQPPATAKQASSFLRSQLLSTTTETATTTETTTHACVRATTTINHLYSSSSFSSCCFQSPFSLKRSTNTFPQQEQQQLKRWASSSSSDTTSGTSRSKPKSSRNKNLSSSSSSPSPFGTVDPNNEATAALDSYLENVSGYKRPVLHWYPGHIGKAERLLKESFLQAVDVVVEVRDARIPKATSHPKVALWCAGKPRVVVLTHVDQIPKAAQRAWTKAYAAFGAEHYLYAQQYASHKVWQNKDQQAARERAKYQKKNRNRQNKNNDNNNNKDDDHAASEENTNTISGSNIQAVAFVNAKEGGGIHQLKRAILDAGAFVQERRARRGLKERALRVGILGYPNVGKSALINKLLGRKRAKTANTPGITRNLQWIRVRTDQDVSTSSSGSSNNSRGGKSSSSEFELLDSPGIIPLEMNHLQSDATLLAACNCIGYSAYDNQEVAAYFCQWMLALHEFHYDRRAAPRWRRAFIDRYKFDPLSEKEVVELRPLSGGENGRLWNENDDKNSDDDDDDDDHNDKRDDPPLYTRRIPRTGDDLLHEVADRTCGGSLEDAATKILQDFRAGRMGPICLQMAPETSSDPGQAVILKQNSDIEQRKQAALALEQSLLQERALAARQAAEDMGLALPPVLLERERQAALLLTEEQEQDDHVYDDDDKDENRNATNGNHKDAATNESSIGRGLFEGW